MVCFKKFKLIINKLWHILNVRFPRPVATSVEPTKKAVASNVATCPTTGQPHLFHHAHWHEGKLYYKGKVVAEKEVVAE